MAIYRVVLRYTKTVEITLQVNDCRVVSLKITGDFFLYPEDTIERVESRATECENIRCLEDALLELSRVIVLGFDPADVSRRVLSAYIELCKGS